MRIFEVKQKTKTQTSNKLDLNEIHTTLRRLKRKLIVCTIKQILQKIMPKGYVKFYILLCRTANFIFITSLQAVIALTFMILFYLTYNDYNCVYD